MPALPSQYLAAGVPVGMPLAGENQSDVLSDDIGGCSQHAYFAPALDDEDVPALTQQHPYQLQLNNGWNYLSNPYPFSIVWGCCKVLYNGQLYALPDAMRIGLLRGELWCWDEADGEYTLPANLSSESEIDQAIKPHTDYWLFAGETVTLILTPQRARMAMQATFPRIKALAVGEANQWQVNIITEASGTIDRNTIFGVSPDGNSGNVMKPPISPAGLSAYFPTTIWGRMSGHYADDFQSPGETYSWALDVECKQKHQTVTLRWPDLSGVPANMPLFLTDEATGQQIAMRNSRTLTFNSGNGGIRQFSITAGGNASAPR